MPWAHIRSRATATMRACELSLGKGPSISRPFAILPGFASMPDSAQQRANLVATQLRTNDVNEPRLIKAVLEVPREDFVPGALKHLAYMEGYIPLANRRVL